MIFDDHSLLNSIVSSVISLFEEKLKQRKTMKKRSEAVKCLLWIVISLSFGSIAVGILLGFINNKEVVFDLNVFISWFLPSLGTLAMALTGLLIYKQFKAQKEINHYTIMPKLKSIVTKDNHNICTRAHRINIHFSHMFINESVNSGYARIGVYAFVSNSDRDSKEPEYYCYKLRPHRCQFSFGFENEIEIYAGIKINSSYQLPYAFKRINNKPISDNIDNDKNDILCDYGIIKDTLMHISGCQIYNASDKPLISNYNNKKQHTYYELKEHIFRMYFCFLCAVRSKNNQKNTYDYLIKDIRNVSFNKPDEEKERDQEYLKNNFGFQKPYKLPKFLDNMLPRLAEDGTLIIPEVENYRVTASFKE